MDATLTQNAERRKHVRLKLRADLIISTQKYEGKTNQVVKDPISLKYYRFSEREYFVLTLLDGKHTMEEVQKLFERRFRPDRLTLEDLESFARQLVTAGLVLHESPNAAKHLFKQQRKQQRMKRIATFTNILYLKIPLFDPDRLLNWMIKYTRWMFTTWFLLASVGVMLAALLLVTMHFQTFWDKLPTANEFFAFRTLLYMWISLGVVKVIHEFGHGLTCKAFGKEVHEMGFLLLCLSPALYCNVTDAWTVSSKWKRILISFAGIYVELMIAAIATFVWWYTPHMPFTNSIALTLMTLCSVSTFIFNANPLMRFDGYYIMSDWLEIPNLRQRSNKYLGNVVSDKCLGIEVQPEPYMKPSRKVLFVLYAITSWLYRWVITFSIIWFLASWLKPYKLETLSWLLAAFALGTMLFWPLYRLRKNLKQRGRLPDMKTHRVLITTSVVATVVLLFFLMPLPISRVIETGLVQVSPPPAEQAHRELNPAPVPLVASGILTALHVRDGEWVQRGQLLAEFVNPELEEEILDFEAKAEIYRQEGAAKQRALDQKPRDMTADMMFQWKKQIEEARGKAKEHEEQAGLRRQLLESLRELRAPRDGYVMSPPRPEDVGKTFDKDKDKIFCRVGDPERLRVLVPVDPQDYRLLREDLAERGTLEVEVYVPGRSDRLFRGVVAELPETNAATVPVQLTHRGGGSLAVKQGEDADPANPAPLSQVYLVKVDILDPDATIHPGALAQVKIHCAWRSTAWWVWRGVAEMLDLGLLGA